MRHLTFRGLFCLAALTLLAVPVLAQRTTGEIIGRVTDASGAVLPGVTVTLRGAGVAGAPTAVTSENGLYRFPVLPPGLYDLDFALQGFTTVRREGVQVAVGSTVELDVPLAVGALEETVTVTGESPVVSVSTSQVSTSYNKEWVQNAPLEEILVLRPDHVGAGHQPDVAAGVDLDGHVAGIEHEREPVPDRRHRHQRNAVAEHRRGGRGRGAPARRLGRVRQRSGRRVQHRHAAGRECAARRCQRLLPERQPDEPQHDGRLRQWVALSHRRSA